MYIKIIYNSMGGKYMSKVGSATLRVSGLASGIDTDSAVEQLLAADNTRITNTKKNITFLEWKQTAYKDIANSLRTFKNTYFNYTKPETNFASASMFKKFTSSVTVNGVDSSAVTVEAGSSANVGSFEMQVVQLATKDKYLSSGTQGIKTAALTSATSSTKIADLYEGTDIQSSTITINGKTIDIAADETIATLVNKVNKSDAGVTMSFNSISGKIALESKTEGEAITFSGNGGDLFTKFNLDSADAHQVVAQGSKIVVDGVTHEESTNTIKVDGMTLTLNSTTAKDDGAGNIIYDTVKIGLTTNVDGIVDSVKKFVEEYNKIVKSLNDQVKEKRPRTTDKEYYLPLTEDEESAMSESQVEAWNKKAKSGLLYNDSTVKEVISNLRSVLYKPVKMENGEEIYLHEVGITTSKNAITEAGQLVIDETKLRAALEKDPNAVAQLFANEDGIAAKLDEQIDKAISTSSKTPGTLTIKAGGENTYLDDNYMYSQIKSQNELLARLVSKMETKSDRYYKMFTNLEMAMSKANAQTSWLSSQAG